MISCLGFLLDPRRNQRQFAGWKFLIGRHFSELAAQDIVPNN